MPPSLLATLCLALCILAPGGLRAETGSLFGGGGLLSAGATPLAGAGAPLIAARAEMPAGAASEGAPAPRTARRGASLFAGREGLSLFAASVARAPEIVTMPGLRRALSGSRIERLRQIIEYAESRRDGYDAVQHGARIKPPGRPTALTLGQIDRWIRDTPGQPHAIGRYQFIPATLRRLVRRVGLPPEARFTPAVQDRLADELLREAGLDDAIDGRIGRHAFMNNLAKIWAGLPNASGRSHYDGYAGNKASISWEAYEAEMAMLFPG